MMTPLITTAIVVLLVLITMARANRAPDFIIWGGVALLMVAPVEQSDGGYTIGLLSAADALSGLANEGLLTIAALFIVAAGVRETGALHLLAGRLLVAPSSERAAQHRIVWPTALMSSVFNNTPLVALLLPVADDWARRYRISQSRLLLPLSYASILGGACTLIGTSTHLIANGWLIQSAGLTGLGIFELTPFMLPIACCGLMFVIVCSRWALPARERAFPDLGNAREYVVEMQIEDRSSLAGQTVDEAGLRGLPGLFLIEIERTGEIIPAVSGNVRLAAGDHLIFAGVVDSVVDLQRFEGLTLATDQVFKLDAKRANRRLLEAVVSNSCPLIGRTIRAGQFRTVYNAAVIAVARNGTRIRGKVGDIRLLPGDVLLLEARPNFLEQQRNRRDFYLVSEIESASPLARERAPIALLLVAGMLAASGSGLVSVYTASLLAALLTVASGCCSASVARRAIDWEVVLVIGGALALGKAMENSGLSSLLGGAIAALVGSSPTATLAALFLASAVLAGVVTAKASVVLMLPVALAIAEQLNLALMPLVVIVMLASATAVATPIGYPTNLMVMGPGGYRFSDYLRLGGPLTLFVGGLGVLLVPLFWPLS